MAQVEIKGPGLDEEDFLLFFIAIFGNQGERGVAVEELLKRDQGEAVRLQNQETKVRRESIGSRLGRIFGRRE